MKKIIISFCIGLSIISGCFGQDFSDSDDYEDDFGDWSSIDEVERWVDHYDTNDDGVFNAHDDGDPFDAYEYDHDYNNDGEYNYLDDLSNEEFWEIQGDEEYRDIHRNDHDAQRCVENHSADEWRTDGGEHGIFILDPCDERHPDFDPVRCYPEDFNYSREEEEEEEYRESCIDNYDPCYCDGICNDSSGGGGYSYGGEDPDDDPYDSGDSNNYEDDFVESCGTSCSPGYVSDGNCGCKKTEKKKWYLDKDGDGYYKEVKEQVEKPLGEGWNTTSNQGEDCDDTNPDITAQSNCDLLKQAQHLLDNAPPLLSSGEVLKRYQRDFADVYKQIGGVKNRLIASTFEQAVENNFIGTREHLALANNAKQILEITKVEQFSVDDSDPERQKLVAQRGLKVRLYNEHGDVIASIDDNQLAERYVDDLTDTLTVNNTQSVDYIFTTLLAINPVTALMYLAIKKYYEIEQDRIRRENPTWSDTQVTVESIISLTQSGLDVAGMVPVIGEVADGANGVIYLVRGDVTNAGISFAALLPIGGQAVTGTRLAVKVAKGVESVAVPLAKNADEVIKLADFGKDADRVIENLNSGARIIEDGTGAFRTVKGHHPMAKKAFEGASNYNPRSAFSVSKNKLEQFAEPGVHNTITGKQNSLYSAWKRANPNKKMTINDMAEIEVRAMKESGIPEDVAKGWAKKAVEDLKSQGVFEIKNIPWNGVNPQ